jgi:hypothetical protein
MESRVAVAVMIVQPSVERVIETTQEAGEIMAIIIPDTPILTALMAYLPEC